MNIQPAPEWNYPLGPSDISGAVLFFLGTLYVALMQLNGAEKPVINKDDRAMLNSAVQLGRFLLPYIPLLILQFMDHFVFLAAGIFIALAQIDKSKIFNRIQGFRGQPFLRMPLVTIGLVYLTLVLGAAFAKAFFAAGIVASMGVAAFLLAYGIDAFMKSVQPKKRTVAATVISLIFAAIVALHVYLQSRYYLPCCYYSTDTFVIKNDSVGDNGRCFICHPSSE